MTQTQDESNGQSTSAVPPEAAPAAPPMMRLSPQELKQVNLLMRTPAPLTPPTPVDASSQREVADAAKPLAACNAGEFCEGDIVPPRDMRVTQPVDIGGVQGTVTVTPGKARIRIPF